MTIVGTLTGTDETTARERLARMTDSDTEPTLSSSDLDDLLGVSARIDESGYYRGNTSWTATWDLNAGAAEGWLRKAGRAAKDFTFAEDGQRFDRAQVYQHCMSQHELYARKGMGVVT